MLQNLRMKLRAHPVVGTIAVMLIYFVSNNLLSGLFSLLPGSLAVDALLQALIIIWAFALVKITGFGAVYKKPALGRSMLLVLPFLILYGLLFIGQAASVFYMPEMQWAPLFDMLYGLLLLFAVAFGEESIYRGIVVNLLAHGGLKTRRDILRVVLLSGFLFGAIHMTNALSGVTLYSAFFQSIGAAACGCLYAAYYLRGGSIWGVIAFHFMMDASALFEALFLVDGGVTEQLNTISPTVLLMSAVMLLLSMFLLRKSRCADIIAQREKHFSDL